MLARLCMCVGVLGMGIGKSDRKGGIQNVKVLSLITESTVEPLTELGNSHLAHH